eukprot:TRINITY_DN2285_c0_g1_i1.p1 TRINITY_DN2285_c0_g1~~TRINITY_DN2285_c0_g1_i1.p1  ORF type:complete len:461 (+),score=71.09 TRINITY_DN2285_c0_g1_i1:64-1446(+)
MATSNHQTSQVYWPTYDVSLVSTNPPSHSHSCPLSSPPPPTYLDHSDVRYYAMSLRTPPSPSYQDALPLEPIYPSTPSYRSAPTPSAYHVPPQPSYQQAPKAYPPVHQEAPLPNPSFSYPSYHQQPSYPDPASNVGPNWQPYNPFPSPSHSQHPSHPQQASYPQYPSHPSSYPQQPYPQQEYPQQAYPQQASFPLQAYPSQATSYPFPQPVPSYSPYYPTAPPPHKPCVVQEIPAIQSLEASVLRTNTSPRQDYPIQLVQEKWEPPYIPHNCQIAPEDETWPLCSVPTQTTQEKTSPAFPFATGPSKSPCNIKDKKSFVICLVYCAMRIEGMGVVWDDAKGCLRVERENPNILPFIRGCRAAFGVREGTINRNYYSEFFDDSKECFRRVGANKKVPKKKPVEVVPNLAEDEKGALREYCVGFVEKLRAMQNLFKQVEGLQDSHKFDAFFNGLGNLHEDIC